MDGERIKMDKVTDIILMSHNNLPRTMSSIEAIYANTNIPFRVTVVDDSTDLTEEYFKRNPRENLVYLRPKVELTDGNQIFNIGFENTESEFVVGMTSSVDVEINWLLPLIRLMEQAEDAAIVQPVHLTPWGTVENAGIYFQEPMMHHQNYGYGEPLQRWLHIRPVDAAGFCCVLFRRKMVYPLETGYYIGFRGFEDVDACLQLRGKGWKTYYCGYSTVYHHAWATTGSPNSWDTENAKKYDENRFRFLTRWANWGEFKKEEE